MKKSLIAFLAASVVSVSAMAGSVSVELREGNLAKRANSTEWKVEAWDKVAGLDAGLELQEKQAEHRGAIKSAVSAKLGKSVEVASVKVMPYAEYGERFTVGNDFAFYGVGAKATIPVVQYVDLSAGFRHREATKNAALMNENRVNVGLNYALSKAYSAGVGVYKTYGTTKETTLGFSLARKF